MTDEFALHRATTKAARAQALVEDELLSEAFNGLEESYIAAWRSTMIDDQAGREKLFLAINVVGKVRDHLVATIANGKLAQAELRQLAETAERKQRWQDIKG